MLEAVIGIVIIFAAGVGLGACIVGLQQSHYRYQRLYEDHKKRLDDEARKRRSM